MGLMKSAFRFCEALFEVRKSLILQNLPETREVLNYAVTLTEMNVLRVVMGDSR